MFVLLQSTEVFSLLNAFLFYFCRILLIKVQHQPLIWLSQSTINFQRYEKVLFSGQETPNTHNDVFPMSTSFLTSKCSPDFVIGDLLESS